MVFIFIQIKSQFLKYLQYVIELEMKLNLLQSDQSLWCVVFLKFFNSLESNMKWILLLLLVFYCGPNDSTSSEIDTTNTRSPRTLEFSSEEEDKNGIHLHIWNDMSNKKIFYPNLMKHIAEESVKSDTDTASTVRDESNPSSSPTHIHFNLNELMPTPQPRVSAANLLKNAFVHTLALDEFRKSDQNLYGSFYKLNTDYKPNTISWNHHPSAVNYIPKPYNTNLSGAISSAPNKLPKTSSTAKTTTSRPTLREQMRTTRNFVQDYYTNLHKIKPKSVIQTVGYEIGGMPKYSGRLLANEPTPQQYRTFKMFEPQPRQIMLPPHLDYSPHRIPDFKPVPPRLKIIPVIDEILDSGNQLAVDDLSKSLPWNLVKIAQKSKPNYPQPVMPKPLQIIPFKLSEAITMAPFLNYIPKTEYNHIEPSTEAYHHSLLSPDIETLQSIRAAQNQIVLPTISTKPKITTTTKAPRFIGYLPNQYDAQQSNYSTSVYGQFSNEPYKTDSKSKKFFNEHNEHNEQYSSDYEYTIHKNSSHIVDLNKPVSLVNSRSNFTNRTQITNQQINDIDIVHAAKKKLYKKTKTMRKPQQPSTDERSINDVTNLNITGFQKINDDDCNSNSGSTQNDTIKTKCNTKISNGMYTLRLGTSNNDRRNVLIDSVPSNSIQLSQTYSRQTTNIPQHKPTSSPLLLVPTTTIEKEEDESILRQLLANDIKKALLTLLGNDTISNDQDASAAHDPFLITVYDENDRAMRDDTDVNDDLQLATSNSMENGRNTNSSVQKWATDRRDTVVWPIDNNSNKRIQSKLKTKPKTKTKTKSESNSVNNMNLTDKTKQKELKFLVDSNKNNSGTSGSSSSSSSTNNSNSLIDEKYYKWFNEYAEENRKFGRTIISEHFKKVKIEPNISWIILPR